MAAGLGRATGSRSATACCRNGRGRGLGHRQCVRDVVTARAEYVVALDYPRLVSLSRLVCRGLHRVVTKEPMCNGNYESWGRLLGEEVDHPLALPVVRSQTRSDRRDGGGTRRSTGRTAASPGRSRLSLRDPRVSTLRSCPGGGGSSC